MTWSPIGSPASENPHGTEIAGTPASGAGIVNTSFRYIAMGSSVFSPILKAGVGAVGDTIASTSAKARSKSRRISVRTRWAFA